MNSSILTQGSFQFFTVTEHGIEFKPNTPRGDWLDAVKRLCGMYEGATMTRERSLMMLADALNFGEEKFDEEFAAAIDGTREALGLSPKTIANAQWVYGRIPDSLRRENLQLGHYSVIAGLPEGERKDWIDSAIKGGLTVATLRAEVAIVHPETKRGAKRKVKEKPVEESSATVLQKLIDASNWFSANAPTEKMKGPLEKLYKAYRRKWAPGRKRGKP